ncbi:uncharacterized protein Dwil_GK26778 [Drosophila willistoni]|uniref:Uncharacterized protein n=1 Tax=Drosophila willistoni TaxID=7260 RepID=A0A0Q9WRD8_DROWI|nr:uncharacterized protein Dwil_GK26778 [Drosophila willistoni]
MEFQGKWTNVTRCEMEAASCLITLVGCLDLTCQNVHDVLQL